MADEELREGQAVVTPEFKFGLIVAKVILSDQSVVWAVENTVWVRGDPRPRAALFTARQLQLSKVPL